MNWKISILSAMGLCLSLAANAQLNNPNGLAFDSADHLWVANSGASQVLELNPSTGVVLNTITTGINQPARLAFDPYGTLWVANLGNNTITAYDNLTTAGGTLTETISNSAIQRPLALAVDAYGDVFVGNNSANQVLALNDDESLIETQTKDRSGFAFTAPGAMIIHDKDIYVGFGPGSGENAVIKYNAGEFLTGDLKERAVYTSESNTGPTGIALDAAGNGYVSDFYRSSWVKFNSTGGFDFAVTTGVAQPEGIAVDSTGNVYISNSSADNITVYNSSGALIRTL